MKISGTIRALLVFLLVFPFTVIELAAQIIDENEVIPAVMDMYNRRFRRATDPVWEIQGNNYRVTFQFRNQENYAVFQPDGRMKIQRTMMTLEELRPNTQQYLRRNYRGQVVRKASFVQEFPRNRYYEVELVPRRQQNDPDPPVTMVRFANNGNFLSEGSGEDKEEDDEDKIDLPPQLLRDFNRKARNAMDVVWTDVDTALRADYTIRGEEAYILYTHEGEWLFTSVRLNTRYRNLHQGIQRWFNENIDDFDFVHAEDVQEPPRERYLVISIIEKADKELAGDQELLPTRIYFTRAGRHVATVYPEYDIVEQERREREDRRWQRATSDDALADGDGIGESISIRELPTRAQQFLNSRYDHEWRTEVCRIIPDETHRMLYQVVMRQQGREIQHEHFFDINGNLIEEEDDDWY